MAGAEAGLRVPRADGKGQDPPCDSAGHAGGGRGQVGEVPVMRAAGVRPEGCEGARQAGRAVPGAVQGRPAYPGRVRLHPAGLGRGEAAVPGDVELLRAPVDGADDQHRVREVGHGVGGRQAGIGAGGQDRAPWQAGGVQGREPPRHRLAHAGKQEGRVGPAALGEIRRSFVLRPERIG